MKLNIAQVVGLNTDQKAALVVSQVRDSENAFLGLLQLTCDDAFTKGRQALSDLADFYFDFEGTPAQKLTATFKEAVERFSKEGEFDLSLAGVSGKVLYLTWQNQVDVYLKRLDKLSSLLTTGSEGQLISGFLQEGDKLLLATKSLVSFLGEDLGKTLDLTKDLWEEEMSSKVGVETADQGLAGLFVQVEVSEESKVGLPPVAEPQYIPEATTEDIPSVSFLSKILGKLGNLLKIFPQSGRGRLILAVVLILIIGLGVGLKYISSRNQQRQALFNQTLQLSKDEFNAAKGLATLNPAEAKNKLDAASSKVSEALKLNPKDSEAQNLKKEIEQESSAILQQFSASSLPLFLELDLIKENFKASKLSLSAGKMLLLDPSSGSLAVIDVAKKSHQILAGSQQIGEATLYSLNGLVAFTYSQDKGVIRSDLSNQKQTPVAKVDKDWGSISDVYGFAGNVYLLDSGKNQVWKYLPTTGGYSDKREYLTKDTKADFAGSLRMQIESSIYVLKAGGEMLRFTKGVKDNFGYEGLDKGVKDPKSFFVSSDTDNLYLLDSGNSRLLVLTKTGSYKVQYQGDKFGSADDLVVDEKEKKVYLLEGNKIYQMDLK